MQEWLLVAVLCPNSAEKIRCVGSGWPVIHLAILEYSQQWKEGRIQLPEYWDQAFADIKEAKEAEASLVELARNPLGNYEGSQAELYDESKVPSDKDWEQ